MNRVLKEVGYWILMAVIFFVGCLLLTLLSGMLFDQAGLEDIRVRTVFNFLIGMLWGVVTVGIAYEFRDRWF